MAVERLTVGHVIPSFVSGGIERLLELTWQPLMENGIELVLISHTANLTNLDRMTRLGARHFHLTDNWRYVRNWVTKTPEMKLRLTELTSQYKLDVIHSQHGGTHPVARSLATWLDLPLIVSDQSLEEVWQYRKDWYYRMLRSQIRRAHEEASTVVCVAGAVETNIRSLGWNVRRYEVIENAVADDWFEPFDLTEKRPYDVVMLGRLADQKNPIFAIRVLAEVCRRRPQTRIAIVGDGDRRPQVEETIQSEGIGANIEMFGQQPPERVIDIARQSKVFFAPSLFEGLSLACVEVLAQGLDAVVSTSPAFTEPFASEQGLAFCDPRNLSENALALEAMLGAYTPRPRPHLKTRFNVGANVEKIAAAYRRAKSESGLTP